MPPALHRLTPRAGRRAPLVRAARRVVRAARLGAALALTLALAGASLSPALAASPRPAPPAEAPRFTPAEAAAQRDALRARGEASLAEARADLPADAPPPPAMAPDFRLTDQTGAPIGRDALAGRPWLLFFGYIVDQSLCSASLPRIAGAVNILEDAGVEVTPVIASIDPAQDRPGPMGPALARWHPRMEGLTGDAEALADLRRAFGVELEQVGVLPDGAPIWIHGGLLYLVGADGRVLAALPPLMEPRRLAEVVAHLL